MPKSPSTRGCEFFPSWDLISFSMAAAFFSLLMSTFLTYRLEAGLYGPLRETGRSSCATQRKQASTQGGCLFQRTDERNGQLVAEYGFVNFNNDPLRLEYSYPAKEFSTYKQNYGYSEAELEALRQSQTKALDDALHHAQKNRLKQEQLNQMCDKINADHKAGVRSFLSSRGFAMLPPGNVLVADIQGVVKRNVKALHPVAVSLGATAEKLDYGSDELINAAVSLVQTAILYENVPGEIRGRRTGGIYPPIETITKGKGDCDTKTALLASILLNWDRIKLVGVAVPKHYLMGVLRNPAKGELFVEYKGHRYVLIEPAGPAWLPPGSVSPRTVEALQAGQGLRIEPLTAH